MFLLPLQCSIETQPTERDVLTHSGICNNRVKTVEDKIARSRLIQCISNESGIKTQTVQRVMQSFVKVAKAALEEGTEVEIQNFGRFVLTEFKPLVSNCVRTGKNGTTNPDESTAQKIYNPPFSRISFRMKTEWKREHRRNSMRLPAPEDLPEGTVLSRTLFDLIRVRYGDEMAMKYPYSSDQIVECEDGTHMLESGYTKRDKFKREHFHY